MPKPPYVTGIKELLFSPGEWDSIPPEASGVRIWSRNGKFHRKDGHAIEYPNGIKVWYYDGVWCCTEDRFRVIGADNTTGDRFMFIDWIISQKEKLEDRYEKED